MGQNRSRQQQAYNPYGHHQQQQQQNCFQFTVKF